MMQVVEYTKKYVSDSTAHRRRSQVIEKMKEITSAGANCFSCSGVCCTFVGNSMMVTPIEAIELVHFLNEQGRWNNELLEKLNETILIYRLDRPVPSDGRRSFSRRRYTCPFFTEGKDGGCSIRKRYKPFGCLGFNAIDSGVRDGENCKSYLSTLEDREREHGASEKQLNAQIRQELGLDWEKKNMPLALKELFLMKSINI